MTIKFWLILLTCLMCSCASTPKIEPINEINYTNYIKTRIIIECISLEGDKKLQAISLDKVYENLKFTAEFYYELNIDFFIVDVEYVEFDGDRTEIRCLTEDGLKHPNELPIYYLIVKPKQGKLANGWYVGGMGAMPGLKANGIALYPWANDKWSLPHEIGHWLSCLHTFEKGGDGIDDTEDTDNPFYANIMNYSICDERFVTCGQLDRMKQCIEYFRYDTILRISK